MSSSVWMMLRATSGGSRAALEKTALQRQPAQLAGESAGVSIPIAQLKDLDKAQARRAASSRTAGLLVTVLRRRWWNGCNAGRRIAVWSVSTRRSWRSPVREAGLRRR